MQYRTPFRGPTTCQQKTIVYLKKQLKRARNRNLKKIKIKHRRHFGAYLSAPALGGKRPQPLNFQKKKRMGGGCCILYVACITRRAHKKLSGFLCTRQTWSSGCKRRANIFLKIQAAREKKMVCAHVRLWGEVSGRDAFDNLGDVCTNTCICKIERGGKRRCLKVCGSSTHTVRQDDIPFSFFFLKNERERDKGGERT